MGSNNFADGTLEATVLVFLVVLLGSCAGRGAPPQDSFATNWRGRTAPAFEASLLGDSSFDLRSYRRRKTVVINFFASWCPPCRAELPDLNQLYHSHKDRVLLVGISLNEKERAVKKFMRELNVEFPVLMDPHEEEGSISELYEVPTLPTTVVVDRSGKVSYYRPGMLQKYDFDYIETLIKKDAGQNR